MPLRADHSPIIDRITVSQLAALAADDDGGEPGEGDGAGDDGDVPGTGDGDDGAGGSDGSAPGGGSQSDQNGDGTSDNASGTLPFTGADALAGILVAIALILGGVTTVLVRRRMGKR